MARCYCLPTSTMSVERDTPMNKTRASILALVMMVAGTLLPGFATTQAAADIDVYTTPGTHTVNGRQWKTVCSKYSSTIERCRTEIWATPVAEKNGRYVTSNGWVFNNLTYKASPRRTWINNNPCPGRRAPRPRRGFPGRPCLPERPGERFCRPCRSEGEARQQRGADCDWCDELPCSTNDVLFDSPVDDVVTRDATARVRQKLAGSALRFRAFTRGVRTIRPHPTREKRGS